MRSFDRTVSAGAVLYFLVGEVSHKLMSRLQLLSAVLAATFAEHRRCGLVSVYTAAWCEQLACGCCMEDA